MDTHPKGCRHWGAPHTDTCAVTLKFPQPHPRLEADPQRIDIERRARAAFPPKAAFQHEAAPQPRPQDRPQGPDVVRTTSGRVSKPQPEYVPQWQPQLDAKAAAKRAAADRRAARQKELDEAIDLRPKADTVALAARLGITL